MQAVLNAIRNILIRPMQSPDLHIHPTNATVVEGNGADVGVTNDFDGQTRASFTPVDIGADAGNFNGIDLSAPNITYTALGNTSLNIKSNSDRDAYRCYRRCDGRFSSAHLLSTRTPARISRRLARCRAARSKRRLELHDRQRDVGGVVATDVIRYFVVAQDTLGNLAANPSGGFTGTDVNTVTTPPTTPNHIHDRGGDHAARSTSAPARPITSLTNTGGIFDAINNAEVTGNITINITSDLTTELGTVALNQCRRSSHSRF